MTDFDAYLMVDWSASNKPNKREDSIWYCMLMRTSKGCSLCPPQNPATRQEAFTRIRNLLLENIERKLSTLVSFDFPYGYPSGFASALRLKRSKHRPKWRQVWNTISQLVKDSEANRNNRFEVGEQLNKKLSGGRHPFWGHPQGVKLPLLSACKPGEHLAMPFCEKRITEQRVTKAQPVWKLAYPGAVGSQALIGIPYVARLRDDRALARHSRLWPFETGLRKLPSRAKRKWFVLHAEIYPSIIKVTPGKGEVKDAAQVRALARHFAQLDKEGSLQAFFEGPGDLSQQQRRLVEREEGWILGV
ncbi:MAG: cobalamin biosynthesis protein CbiG [Terriglobia bacterium]